jgi:hypothetical protein
MKYLKLYEELSPELLRRAGDLLKRKGHQNRGQNLIDYSHIDQEQRTKKVIKFGKGGVYIDHDDIFVDILPEGSYLSQQKKEEKEEIMKDWWDIDDEVDVRKYLNELQEKMKTSRLYLRVYATKTSKRGYPSQGTALFIRSLAIQRLEIGKQVGDQKINVLHVIPASSGSTLSERKDAVFVVNKIREFLVSKHLILNTSLKINDFYKELRN